ncbi:MAG: hypothetical protein HPY50_16440 [Firmicutes bacterium]|nr:hypothetical protein [Bacillota bacterium]
MDDTQANTPEVIADNIESIAAGLKRAYPQYYEELMNLAAKTREKNWQLVSLGNVINKIAQLRKSSLSRAREPGVSPVERAYFMAEANTYNVALDIMADEFGREVIWRLVE